MLVFPTVFNYTLKFTFRLTKHVWGGASSVIGCKKPNVLQLKFASVFYYISFWLRTEVLDQHQLTGYL